MSAIAREADIFWVEATSPFNPRQTLKNGAGQARFGNVNMNFIRTRTACRTESALTAKSLVPASSTVIAAAKDKNQYEDNDEKYRVGSRTSES